MSRYFKELDRKGGLSDLQTAVIIALFELDNDVDKAAAYLGISPALVQRTIEHYKHHGPPSVAVPGSVSNVGLSRQRKTIMNSIAVNPLLPPNEQFAKIKGSPLNCSFETYQQYLQSLDVVPREAIISPALDRLQMEARVEFAKANVDATGEWKKVIWSGEARFCGRPKHGEAMVLCTEEDAALPCMAMRKCGHPDVYVMVWGCFIDTHPGPLVRIYEALDAAQYCKLVHDHIEPFFQSACDEQQDPSLQFFQEHSASHTAKEPIEALEQGVNVLGGVPAVAVDFNPMRKVWKHLGRKVARRHAEIDSSDALWAVLENEWLNLEPGVLADAVKAVGKTCVKVVKSQGRVVHW